MKICSSDSWKTRVAFICVKLREEGSVKKFISRYLIYLIRWQLSTPILTLVLIWLSGLNTLTATIIANLIGGLVFFWIDRLIFKEARN